MPSGTVSPVPVNTSPTGAAGGDLSSTYPNPTVAKVNGTSFSAAQAAALRGAPVVRGPFAFAFDTASINNGVAFYTPTVGDILIDAWIEVVTAFNGTTPIADIGTFVGTNIGLLSDAAFIDLSQIDGEWRGTGYLEGTQTFGANMTLNAGGASAGSFRLAPGRFTATNQLKVVASQTGQKGGAAVGGTTGAANVYIITATPVAF